MCKFIDHAEEKFQAKFEAHIWQAKFESYICQLYPYLLKELKDIRSQKEH